MSLLRFYPGATPGKKRKQIENYDEKQKKKHKYEKNRPDRKFSSKWLVFNEELEKKYAPTLDNYGQSCFVRISFLKMKCVCTNDALA